MVDRLLRFQTARKLSQRKWQLTFLQCHVEKQTNRQKAEALNYSFWLPAEGIY